LSLVGILAILSLSFGVEGWRIDIELVKDLRTGGTYSFIHPFWDGCAVGVKELILDSKSYVNDFPVGIYFTIPHKEIPRNEVYLHSKISEYNCYSYGFRFTDHPRLWWEYGTLIESGPRLRLRPNVPVDFPDKIKLKGMDLSKKIVINSETFLGFPALLYGKIPDVTAYKDLQLRFDVLNRLNGHVQGAIFWRQRNAGWSAWAPMDVAIKEIYPIGWDGVAFLRISSKENLWDIANSDVDKIARKRLADAGYLVPRSKHGSCFADSLGGWYYEACGDFPASPILEYKSVAVKQQSGQKITPWGRMTWEVRGKKTGWFLPRGQHFLPRVFRTDKAPKVDDFWATPPKGVP